MGILVKTPLGPTFLRARVNGKKRLLRLCLLHYTYAPGPEPWRRIEAKNLGIENTVTENPMRHGGVVEGKMISYEPS